MKRRRFVVPAIVAKSAAAAALATGTNHLWYDCHLSWGVPAQATTLGDISANTSIVGVVIQADWPACEASDDSFNFTTVTDEMAAWDFAFPGIKFMIRTAPWGAPSGIPFWLSTSLGTSGKLFKDPGTTGEYIPRAWVSGGTFQAEYAEFLAALAAEFNRTTGSPPAYYANIQYLWAGTGDLSHSSPNPNGEWIPALERDDGANRFTINKWTDYVQ